MNKNNILSMLVLVVLALLVGMALGYVMHNKPDSDASAQPVVASDVHSGNAVDVPSTLHYEFYAIITVRDICRVQQPIRKPVHIHMNVVRTNVQDNVQEEDNSNTDIVTATPTPVITIIVTPTPIITTVPTATSTPVPTDVVDDKCNNGVGNGPDCPPPGHDKDNDGQADTPKGNNDDDESVLPCGDPGNPCNKEGKKDIMLPSFVIAWLIRLLNKNGYSVNKMSKQPISYNDMQHPMLNHFANLDLVDKEINHDGLCQGCWMLGSMNVCSNPYCKNYVPVEYLEP